MEVVTVTKFFTFLTACFLTTLAYAHDYCYFIPPKGWNLANPESLSPRVKIAFLGRSAKGVLPSINLATEQVSISLPAYVEAVKKFHEADPNAKWRDLGAYQTSLGEGRLTEIESQTPAGVVRLMQLIVIKDKTAYILTTGALKEEFPKYYTEFENAFASLKMTSDLTSTVSEKKKAVLDTLVKKLETDIKSVKKQFVTTEQPFELASFQKESWEPFQQKVISDFSEMGAYWQILLLQEVQTKLKNPQGET